MLLRAGHGAVDIELGFLYHNSGAPSDRPRKTVTDSARSGPRPIPLARPPEFVVCPLKCEIQAFRYFWPCSLRWTLSSRGVKSRRTSSSGKFVPPDELVMAELPRQLIPIFGEKLMVAAALAAVDTS